MATLQEQAEAVAAQHGVAAEAVRVHRTGNAYRVIVTLPNGREISTDKVDGWEQKLGKAIAKFKNKD